ncbi:Phosphatidylinositol transfer protein alpha isoform [Meloidogyne graminicola]|uniref:Phosphatidylinositol transfer protein alpha isoform n=1 Tax=Meloidogyne graminicola TaxID=189291 RepID=A0A8S9Z826_9BILA|nr:Phosphatidylinositol transfer protein alpha isoform [Meloidogyne graminicola]
MLVREYRIVMPMSAEEFRIGRAFSYMEVARKQTQKGEGVEIVQDEPFDNIPLCNGRYTEGQFTHKIYHMRSKIPAFIRPFVPNGLTRIHEYSWNSFPYLLTELYAPEWDENRERFSIRFETLCLDNNRGLDENALGLSKDVLKRREVIRMNIGDENNFQSKRTFRGPLVGKWQEKCKPCMCVYKVVTCIVKAHFPGAEKLVELEHRKINFKFHQQIFTSIDRWYGMTWEQVRNQEIELRTELDTARNSSLATAASVKN